MQASERARELERVYQQRRGHAPQISISDDNHHVTEAIGDLYGHDQDHNLKRSSRPLSFISNPLGDTLEAGFQPFDPFPNTTTKSPLRSQFLDNDTSSQSASVNGGSPTPTRQASTGRAGFTKPTTPPPLSRTPSDTATQQFPLNDLDYESSAAGLAQEISNLQAIRRMSMDVNTADPDLPSFKTFAGVPPIPPHFSDEDDPSKLFWVPARLHPELAPKEFKTFIEEKVDSIRRRSGDAESLSPDGPLGRQASGGGGLRRKKSMLSRQIDSGNGYRDGAERLERQRSGASQGKGAPPLQELEHIVEDATSRISSDSTSRHSANSTVDGEAGEDIPILPGNVPGMVTLKRSTRTNYRRGSLRKGERVPPRPRGLIRQTEPEKDDSLATSESPDRPSAPSRVQTEPIPPPENFSRPTRRRTPPPSQTRTDEVGDAVRAGTDVAGNVAQGARTSQPAKHFHSRIASNGRTTAPLPGYAPQQIPQIIETPPPPDRHQIPQLQLPERHSSKQAPITSTPQPISSQRLPVQTPKQPRPVTSVRLNRHAQAAQASPIEPAQTFDDLIAHPAPLPGNTNRVDSLSIIPNLPEEKKLDNNKKAKDKKDGHEGVRKTSWGWLLGGDDKERDKKEKEEREKELAKKVKNKLSKPPEKGHDETRLDVLQSSIQKDRGRESVVLDRESIKLEEERKKESTRKSATSDAKKEKESGLFSSLFGGGKKKGEKEMHHKKGSSLRGLSPDPPPRILKPDIDYNWTRFSILEERAIYRMAHIKLANPRRELYSQVLLSNFMYSYLAKVQQMHPQIQIGTSAQAKQQQQRQAAQQQKKEPQQPEEYSQYQRYQQQQQEPDKTATSQADQQQDGRAAEPAHTNGGAQQPYRIQPRDPRDSHHSNYDASNGGYSVANSQSYMGYTDRSGRGHYGYDDSDESSREETW